MTEGMNAQFSRQNWWLFRHAPVTAPTLYGQLDIDADLPSDSVFKGVSAILPSRFRLISSDLRRCRQTAEKIAEHHPTKPDIAQTLPGFREQHFGYWQGLSYQQIEDANKSEYDAFWQNPVSHKPPGGESFEQLAERVCELRRSITEHENAEDVLLVSHAGTIRALVAEALDIPLARSLSLVIEPLSLTKLTVFNSSEGESWQVTCVNQSVIQAG
ncbi:MAG: histidine phosphatase family protein [Sneathiella sp.]